MLTAERAEYACAALAGGLTFGNWAGYRDGQLAHRYFGWSYIRRTWKVLRESSAPNVSQQMPV